ncbi:MAG TPA: carbon-nitrogen hydrolase family protein [Ignavibacteria bacterium]|nr:carbon-nitrogen hydrolase family protein [Ignavibacteria bacterium]
MKIAIAQVNPVNDNQISLRNGIELVKKAKEDNADLILFPEMYNNGYNVEQSRLDKAVTIDDDYLNEFRNAAQMFNIAIAVTFLEKKKNCYCNSALLIDRNGIDVLHYSKIHICEFDKESVLTPGEEFFVSELSTEHENVKVGFMICFDREFPESARVLMLKGAELILVPNACEIEMNRRAQLKSRAFENSVAIVMANYSGEIYKGNSMAISPVAFDKNGNSLENVILECKNEEGLFFAEIDPENIREYRRREVWGNAYRKEYAYKLISEKVVVPDFERD